jgi:hypothetical protein
MTLGLSGTRLVLLSGLGRDVSRLPRSRGVFSPPSRCRAGVKYNGDSLQAGFQEDIIE